MFTLNARKKHKKARRYSGGISVVIRKDLKAGVKFFSSKSDFYVWCKFDKTFFNLNEDIYVCSCYIPPKNSKSKSLLVNTLDPFAEMQKDISRFEKLGKIILMGDFNARKGNLSDLNYLNQSEFITSLLEDNDSNINMRNSSLTNCHVRDKGVNSYGKSLIDICCTNQLCILNGRTKGDRFGNFTCFTYNGCSTVDYAITSNSLFSDVIYFTVHPLSLLSNHCPISFALRTGKFSIQPNSDDFLNSKPQSFKMAFCCQTIISDNS